MDLNLCRQTKDKWAFRVAISLLLGLLLLFNGHYFEVNLGQPLPPRVLLLYLFQK